MQRFTMQELKDFFQLQQVLEASSVKTKQNKTHRKTIQKSRNYIIQKILNYLSNLISFACSK